MGKEHNNTTHNSFAQTLMTDTRHTSGSQTINDN